MKSMNRLYSICFLLAMMLPVNAWADKIDLEQVYRQLDEAIEQTDQYVMARENRIQGLKAARGAVDEPRAQYDLSRSLYDEYRPYISDSAIYYIKHAPRPASARDSILYLQLMSEVEHLYWKNEGKSKDYIQSAHAMADSMTINGLNHRLLEVEKKYDVQLAELNQVKNESRLRGTLLIAALLALGLLGLAFLVWNNN